MCTDNLININALAELCPIAFHNHYFKIKHRSLYAHFLNNINFLVQHTPSKKWMSKAMSNAVQVQISIMSQHQKVWMTFLLLWAVIEFVWKAEELHSSWAFIERTPCFSLYPTHTAPGHCHCLLIKAITIKKLSYHLKQPQDCPDSWQGYE